MQADHMGIMPCGKGTEAKSKNADTTQQQQTATNTEQQQQLQHALTIHKDSIILSLHFLLISDFQWGSFRYR